MSYLMNKFEYLECPECKQRFALRWDIFPHVCCPYCHVLIELSKNRLTKPSEKLQAELKQDYHYRKLELKIMR